MACTIIERKRDREKESKRESVKDKSQSVRDIEGKWERKKGSR